MSCVILATDVFEDWLFALTGEEQTSVAAIVGLLRDRGVTLGYPYSSGLHGSRHGHLRELRVQHRGRPLRILYAFDPRRNAVLLLGGDKGGDDRWYERHIPLADKLYDQHLFKLNIQPRGKK